MKEAYHIPVLAKESIEGLNILSGHNIVDATFGGGGHSKLILEHLKEGKLFAFDQDKDAAKQVINNRQLIFIRHNFRYVRNFLRYYNIEKVDSIFADLGVSSHEFDVPERGFSFRFDARLDMRMNQNASTDASEIINNYPEEKLRDIFRMYGEIKNAGRLTAEIIKLRNKKAIITTTQLKEIASTCSPKASENKYLAQVFQALRIEVNQEMDALREFLEATLEILKPNGRLVILTYHSLEDRICKNFMRTGNFNGKIIKDFYGNIESPFKIINRKVITPKEEELKSNSRSRSAKLRIAERI